MSDSIINYVHGDATRPLGTPAIIAHVCNDCGLWGSGFVLAISKIWKQPEKTYRAATALRLGDVQFVEVGKDITVANMIAQHGIYSPGSPYHQKKPLVYDALYRSLFQVAARAKKEKADLHMPKIGADRAKGDWSIIASIIQSACNEHGVKAYVYLL